MLKGEIKRAKKLSEPIVLYRDKKICEIVKERMDKNLKRQRKKVGVKEVLIND